MMNNIREYNKEILKSNSKTVGVLFLIGILQVVETVQMFKLERMGYTAMQWFYLILTPIVLWRVFKTLGTALRLSDVMKVNGEKEGMNMLKHISNMMMFIVFLKFIGLLIVGKTVFDGDFSFEQAIMILSSIATIVLIIKVSIVNVNRVMNTEFLN